MKDIGNDGEHATAEGADTGGATGSVERRPERVRAIPGKLLKLAALKMEYMIFRHENNGDGLTRGVRGIKDTEINALANKGWRVVSASWAGRKLLAAVLERPRERVKKKAKKPDPSVTGGGQ
jgi:hypothetical protein